MTRKEIDALKNTQRRKAKFAKRKNDNKRY